METIQGIAVSGGYCIGKALVYRHGQVRVSYEMTVSADEAKDEIRRFSEASDSVYDEISALLSEKRTKEEISLLESQLFMIRDPEFVQSVHEYINLEHYNAGWAVESAANKIITTLNAISSPLFRERIADIQEIASRIIGALDQSDSSPLSLDEPSIVVADTLLPFEFLSVNREYLLGIALESGGRTSHVAILARSLSIPCLMGLKDVTSAVADGGAVAMDAFKGDFYVSPDDTTIAFIKGKEEKLAEYARTLEEDALLPAITKDGKRILLECNIEGTAALAPAVSAGAEGIGLFRTEFLLMDHSGDGNIEEASYSVYKEVASAFATRGPVTIRTYDIGGDKVVSDIGADEDNPVLGWRAVRFCMDRKDIFRSQLRAILRASVAGNIRIMFPMISGCEELDGVLAFFEEVKSECRLEGIPFDEEMKVGIMIEVPSAAVTSDLLARKVDFFSVGTNDLVQYTIAVDRGNSKIAYLYNTLHPGVLRLLKLTSDNAAKADIELAMCGEMAGDLFTLPLVIGLGYSTLSMTSASLLEARSLIRSISYESCKALATKALDMTSYADIQKLLEEFHAETGNQE